MANGIRKSEIMEFARQNGRVEVEELASSFSVTVHTIRRDLKDLCASGELERVHGGAVLRSGLTNLDYVRRQQMNADGKRGISKLCAEAIPDDSSVFINIGTTTEAVAKKLRNHTKLLVATNSLNTANILATNPNCEIIVAGGTLRRADGGLLGNLTTQVVDLLKFDIAVISCAGIDDDGDLLDFDLQEAHATRTILRQAKAAFVVADKTKIGRAAPGKVGTLKDIHTLFTDASLPPALDAICKQSGTRVVVASE